MKFELLTRVMNTYCWYLDCSRPTVERSDSSNNPLHEEAMISQLRVQTKQCHSIVSFFFSEQFSVVLLVLQVANGI